MKLKSPYIKVNILTGLLGSGKTTMISNIIKLPELKFRVVLIQNDFTEEMGIEKNALKDSDGNSLGDIVELPNGCICCAVKDNVVLFIEKLITKKKDIDLVLIEAHGLSDISELVKKFWLDKELESPIKLNSIICLVDCFNYYKNISSFEKVFLNQIIISDKIVLNKTDLIKSEEELTKLKENVESLNPLGKITMTKFSNVDLNYFLEDLKIYDTTLNYNEKHLLKSYSSHSHGEHNIDQINSDLSSEIENLIINIDNINDKEKLDKIIGSILWIYSEDHDYSLIRFKGVKYLENNKFLLIQGIYDLYEIEEMEGDNYKLTNKDGIESESIEKSKLLLIGKNLKKNAEFLTKLFN